LRDEIPQGSKVLMGFAYKKIGGDKSRLRDFLGGTTTPPRSALCNVKKMCDGEMFFILSCKSM